MGVFKMFSSSSRDKSHSMVGSSMRSASKFDDKKVSELASKSLPNPDPNNYSIQGSSEKGDYLAILIKYHDCTNYEGKKILVFKATLEQLKAQKYIDPHFCDNDKFISPIARFEPTTSGWHDALGYIRKKHNADNRK